MSVDLSFTGEMNWFKKIVQKYTVKLISIIISEIYFLPTINYKIKNLKF